MKVIITVALASAHFSFLLQKANENLKTAYNFMAVELQIKMELILCVYYCNCLAAVHQSVRTKQASLRCFFHSHH
uniref:Uncharacterized protein n=1 Tax=Anguilla anguilla TaxID=7936 RepID=A0A0E9QHV6_ANGAN